MLCRYTIALFLLVHASSEVCSPWTIPYISDEDDNTIHCKCGNLLGGLVNCNNKTLQVSIQNCYCMTYSNQLNSTLKGQCTANCIHSGNTYQYKIKTKNSNLLNVPTIQKRRCCVVSV